MTKRNLTAALILLMLLAGFFIWRANRTQMWDALALTVVWSEASEKFTLTPGEKDFKHEGFALYYSLQNNTGNDITIPANATVMKRLSREHTLTDSSALKLDKAYFVPARQRVKIEIDADYSCSEGDLDTGTVRQRDAHTCFHDALGDSEGLAVFDLTQRIQINLPMPSLKSTSR
jgi:hypothetical protein